jgi:hypothetical protein
MTRFLDIDGHRRQLDKSVRGSVVPHVDQGGATSHDAPSEKDVVESRNDGNESAPLVGLAGRKQEEVAREQPAFGSAIDAGTERASLCKCDRLLDLELHPLRKLGSTGPVDPQRAVLPNDVREVDGRRLGRRSYALGEAAHDVLPAVTAPGIARRKRYPAE